MDHDCVIAVFDVLECDNHCHEFHAVVGRVSETLTQFHALAPKF
jgi:hypothetical protein